MIRHSRIRGLDAVLLQGPDGEQMSLLLQGAHLLAWKPAGAGEQLYLSPASAFATGSPVRGGVPVIFPQFARLGPLAQHGFARTLPWRLDENSSNATTAVLSLSDCDLTRSIWPHRFELQLRIHIAGRQLHLALSCQNTDSTAFEFTAALHTYLAVTDLAQTALKGLQGQRYLDAVDQQPKSQDEALLVPEGQLSRIYHQCPQDLLLCEQVGAALRQVRIGQAGFSDVVVWNPGDALATTMPDIAPGTYRNMLCIEAAQIGTPVRLAPAQSWTGRQMLELL